MYVAAYILWNVGSSKQIWLVRSIANNNNSFLVYKDYYVCVELEIRITKESTYKKES